jgi:hypothetical protein
MKRLCLETLGFICFWLALYYVVMFVLSPLGYDQLYGFPALALFFAAVAGLVFLYMHREQSRGEVRWRMLFVQMAAWIMLGILIDHAWPLSPEQAMRILAKQFYFPLLWPQTLVTKICDVLCQQSLLYFLVQRGVKTKLKNAHIVGLVALVFFIIHLPLLIYAPNLARLVFIPNFFAGAAFAYLLLRPKWGLNFSFALHFGFYMVVGLWIRYGT